MEIPSHWLEKELEALKKSDVLKKLCETAKKDNTDKLVSFQFEKIGQDNVIRDASKLSENCQDMILNFNKMVCDKVQPDGEKIRLAELTSSYIGKKMIKKI